MKVAVIGAAGYTGGMLLRLLSQHPQVTRKNIIAVSKSHAGQDVSAAHSDLFGRGLVFVDSCNEDDVDVFFLCTGHGKSAAWVQEHEVDTDKLVIDMSHDHRLNADWVYGLPEQNREAIRTARRIANPGCFATTIELGLLPLSEDSSMEQALEAAVVQATTGSTGAGQSPSPTTHYSWRANNISVYKPFTHQHLAEIEMVLGTAPTFIPMRGSFPRGILSAAVVPTKMTAAEARALYEERYAEHPFVVVTEDLPDVKRAVGTNACFIGFEDDAGSLLVVSVLDNLIKGASGQAIQNMNLACGFKEDAGLNLVGIGY